MARRHPRRRAGTQALQRLGAAPAYLGRTMALQSSGGFTCGALGSAAFGVMLDWAARLGATPDSKWIWVFGVKAPPIPSPAST